ncbi:MAG TPA: PIN domain-containing protein [Fimbriimonadaceae bacterium]|nr:PIN domain-containing protein [Fimbriimonadaceae bacterium]
MILLDTNLLVYASIRQLPHHAAAHDWLGRVLEGPAAVGMPWPTLLSFIRLTTEGRIFSPPVPLKDAWNQVEAWLESDLVWCPAPTDRHASILSALLAGPDITGRMVHDAHLAALAIEHGLTVCSADTDFARFPEVKWMNPLIQS